MITRIRIEGYKSLGAVEVRDLGALTLIIGPNAAGKSNFLDSLDLLSHLARQDTLLDAFQKHRGNRAERPMPVRWFFHGSQDRSEPRDLRFLVDLELQPRIVSEINRELEERERNTQLERPYTRVTKTRLRYELIVSYQPEARTLQVTHESLIALNKHGDPQESTVPFIRHKAGTNQISVKLERQAHPRYYEVPRTRTLLAEISDTVYHPHLVAAARELRSMRVYYVEPVRMRSAVSDLQATDPGPHGEQLASFYHWLKRKDPVVYANLLHNLTHLIPSVEGIEVREAAEGFLELWVVEKQRGEFPAAMVSEGTLRLLSILGISATPFAPAVVGYEEPENGVNPARLSEMLSIIEHAANFKSGSQFFVTTHSPEVINYLKGAKRIICRQDAGGTVFDELDQLPLFSDTEIEASLGKVVRRKTPIGTRFGRGDFG